MNRFASAQVTKRRLAFFLLDSGRLQVRGLEIGHAPGRVYHEVGNALPSAELWSASPPEAFEQCGVSSWTPAYRNPQPYQLLFRNL